MEIIVICLLYVTVALILARRELEKATERAKEIERKLNKNEWGSF